MFDLTQYMENIMISTCNQNRKLLRYFTFLFSNEVFEIHCFDTYSIFQFRPATLQVLSSHR